jgi:hypothetical protein
MVNIKAHKMVILTLDIGAPSSSTGFGVCQQGERVLIFSHYQRVLFGMRSSLSSLLPI